MDEMPAYDHPDGTLPESVLHAEELEQQGYQQCRNQLCNHMHSPETLASVYAEGGHEATHQCSHCGVEQNPFNAPGKPGGGTNAGFTLEEQSQIGEDLVKGLGEIPGYGRIAWWHSGSAAGPGAISALDGATVEWGIEVKTYNWMNVRKRGIINVKDKKTKAAAVNDPRLFADKIADPTLNEIIDKLEFKGLLGVLVLLDPETGLADIFGHAMPKDPVTGLLAWNQVQHITPNSEDWRRLDPSNPGPPKRKVERSIHKFVIAERVPFASDLPDPRKPDHVPHYLQQQDTSADWGF